MYIFKKWWCSTVIDSFSQFKVSQSVISLKAPQHLVHLKHTKLLQDLCERQVIGPARKLMEIP